MDFSYLDDELEEEGGAPEITPTGEGYRNIWVFGEAAGADLSAATLQALGQAREIADQIGIYVYGLLLGDGVEAVAQHMVAYGADRALVVDDPAFAQYTPDLFTAALVDLVDRFRPEILLLPGTSLGNDLAPRLAQRLNTGLVSHCIRLEIDMSERLLLGTSPVMGGEVYHTFACSEARPQIATLVPGYFPIPYEDTYRSGDVQRVELDLPPLPDRLSWIDPDASVDLPPPPISKARIVVSAGRGLGDAQGFALVEQLANALGGVVAGSRGAFDKGWIGEQQIVGVGGQLVAPDLYIACGLSGDVYHYFGLQDAKFVVAINPDESAPIMRIANMAVVADAREVIPALIQAISQ
jgi:electron transfer flavoprotein alpha subunit